MKDLKKDVVERMLDVIDEVGFYKNPSEMAYHLFQGEVNSGSMDCSAYKAKQWIVKYFDELGDVVRDYEGEYGESLNPFRSPENFQVDVILFVATRILWEVWEDGMTKEELKKELEELI